MQGTLKVGIIGFDTSHVPAFTRLLNDSSDPHHVPGARVVAGVPTFSDDLESSYSRVEGYTQELREQFDIRILDSIDDMLEQIDAVLLESVDGRRHLAEATPVIKARKPVFIDKPLAHNYTDAAKIAALAQEYSCRVFSSSSLRYDANIQALKNDESVGNILTCDAFTNSPLDPTNPGLFFYGIHRVEMLYTFMGAGCQSVMSHASDEYTVVVGRRPNGRIATMRGTRTGTASYGATVYGENKVLHTTYSTEVPFYSQLLKEVVPFLRGERIPVPLEETMEIMAFMQAAMLSEQEKREVALAEITG